MSVQSLPLSYTSYNSLARLTRLDDAKIGAYASVMKWLSEQETVPSRAEMKAKLNEFLCAQTEAA